MPEPRVHPFELRAPDDPRPGAPPRERVVRGRVTAPPGPGPHPVVLVLHGFKGFQDWGFFPLLQRRLADAGLAAASWNHSGSGVGADGETFDDLEGFARHTWTREHEDLARVRAHLARAASGGPGDLGARGGGDRQADGGGGGDAGAAGSGALGVRLDLGRVGVLGHSRGGATALVHAAEAGDLRAVVTWAAVAELDPVDPETRRRWLADGHTVVRNARTGQELRVERSFLDDVDANRARLDPLAACRRLRTPTLLVHGEDDASVPVEHARRLAAALPSGVGTTLVLPGAGHTFGAAHPLAGVLGPAGELPDPLERALAASVDFLAARLR